MDRTFVKLVNIRSQNQGRTAVEVYDLRSGNLLRTVLACNIVGKEQDVRPMLLAACKELPENEVAVFPRRYRMEDVALIAEEYNLTSYFRGMPKAEGDVDVSTGYSAMEWRDVPKEEGTSSSAGAGKPIVTLEQAFEGKVQTKGMRETRGGKQTKASLARSIITAGLEAKKDPETIIAEIAEQCGFKIALARVYFRENVRKVTTLEKK